MTRYRTEIEIPPDGYVCIQLPGYVPAGRAVLTIVVNDRESLPEATSHHPAEHETDRQDIEWWDEFEGEATDDH